MLYIGETILKHDFCPRNVDVHSKKQRVSWFGARDMENPADLDEQVLRMKYQDANKHVDPKLE